MKVKSILAVLLLMVAGLQTAQAQGYRVYKSDGNVVPFNSQSTDSIVFYNNLLNDIDLGPYMVVNQYMVGTWYMSKSETVTFNEDGTTDYMEGATYEFLPYQGIIIIYNSSKMPMNILKVYKATSEKLIVGKVGESKFKVWGTTPQPQLVEEIVLSETLLNLQPDGDHILTATILPEDADNPAVTWESSDEEVAEVTKKGKVNANAEGICIITCRATDGSGVYAECKVIVGDSSPEPNDHEWVDLGLLSGTLWATCNVGANYPEEYGDDFAWGETTGYNSGKTKFSWSTYKYCHGSNTTITKYCTNLSNGTVDNKTELEPGDDAATANWGNGWMMPSLAQCQELFNISYTTKEWTTLNGVKGYKITSKSNGNSIFLPASGYWTDTNLDKVDTGGYYWSRSLGEGNSTAASALFFKSGSTSTATSIRCYGFTVRPVRKVITTR